MAIHPKTAWKDHIVNSSGAVVQQGTPLSAENLLKIEEGIANATAVLPAELGAVIAHSGFIDYTEVIGDLTQAFMAPGQIGIIRNALDSANQIVIGKTKALINGAILQVSPSDFQERIQLPASPTEGTRDDLAFLEAWRDQDTQEWKARIRVVAGVDFIKYPSDGFCVDSPAIDSGSGTHNTAILGQGGNTAPVTNKDYMYAFRNAKQRAANVSIFGLLNDDTGLYVSGIGNDISKSLLKTYDGYVYAIPLVKVNRRNSGGYSVNNANGARDLYTPGSSLSVAINAGQTGQLTVSSEIYAKCHVGDMFDQSGQALGLYTAQIISKDSGTKITVKNVGANAVQTLATYQLRSDRPDSLYSNIIDERDITDLRHKTHLVAPSYEQLLIEGTDRLLRGASQVERKKAMRKTYVGVKKTPLDANHVFYASFDGTMVAEVGGAPTAVGTGAGSMQYIPAPTGAGIGRGSVVNPGREYTVSVNGGNGITIEFWNKLYAQDLNDKGVLLLYSTVDGAATEIRITYDNSSMFVQLGSTQYRSLIKQSNLPLNRWYHFRLVIKGTDVRAYVDGILKNTYVAAVDYSAKSFNRLMLYPHVSYGEYTVNTAQNAADVPFCDVAVSKVDRGTTFATLPADFIAGYADITPALSDQRQINSDAQTSQKSYASAKVKNQTQERCITVTKGAGVNMAAWEAGDKVKVRGIAGEIISGVIDADTALARIMEGGGDIALTSFRVDDVSKLAVNDTVAYYNPTTGTNTTGFNITAIDAVEKRITINPPTFPRAGALLIETTASTSSPIVRAIISGTSTVVPGTWTALGTNEAEITLGVLPGGLVAQDIVIEYSLNMPAGQGSLYQVYTSILGGGANGKKLIPGTVAVTDDFAGKIAVSTVENPHKAYSAVGAVLATPSAPGTEFAQADYNAVKTADNSLKLTTTNVNGQRAQVLVALDVVRAFEDKYGTIPGVYTPAEKVTWIKAAVGRLKISFILYGSGPSGNKAYVRSWFSGGSLWNAMYGDSNSSAVPAMQAQFLNGGPELNNYLDTTGIAYFTCYTDPSDGVTAATLYVDQINIEITVSAKAGYDVLVPENPRRDAGPAGVLYVRRQTREVESLFAGNDEDNGINVIGDYVPKQEITTALSGFTDFLHGTIGIVTTAGTNKASGGANLYKNSIARVLGPGNDLNYRVDPQALVSTIRYEDDNNSLLRYWHAEYPHAGGIQIGSYTDGIPAWAAKASEFLCIAPRLVLSNGEILLRLDVRKRSELTFVGLGGGSNNYYYRLPGRPLVKI